MSNENKAVNRVGARKQMKNGLMCVCTRYANAHDCDFQFDDGAIVDHREWKHFANGNIAYPKNLANERIGVRKQMNCGEWCACVDYVDAKNCDFQFDDGSIVKRQTWQHFENGTIAYPTERIGVRKLMNCGLWCTCVEYVTYKDCTLRFDDGTVLEHQSWQNFENGAIAHPCGLKNTREGFRIRMNNGYECTCIEYRNCMDCDFVFDDGTIVTHRQWGDFVNRKIAHPHRDYAQERVGVRRQMASGEWCTCIRYGSSADCDFQFDDGAIVFNRPWSVFMHGKISRRFAKCTDKCANNK